jgi:hypothetical protein
MCASVFSGLVVSVLVGRVLGSGIPCWVVTVAEVFWEEFYFFDSVYVPFWCDD